MSNPRAHAETTAAKNTTVNTASQSRAPLRKHPTHNPTPPAISTHGNTNAPSHTAQSGSNP
jgi:hypothetical protein